MPPAQERRAWILAATVSLITVLLVAYQMTGDARAAAPGPEMGNVGSAGGRNPVRAPDISQMSPRERFDRLFDRVMGTAERQLADSVAFFAPMALNAYADLDVVDADARYHAAMIHLIVGEVAQAKAQADSVLTENPKHLLGLLIRVEAAAAENDQVTLNRTGASFLAAYETELAATRQEYVDHRPALEALRSRLAATDQASTR